MAIKYTYLSLQELGKRSNQEDSIYPQLGESAPNNGIFILCDGMGGHDCGEVASQAVCESMSSYIIEHPESDFESALNTAYDKLDSLDTFGEKKMGTTMTFVKIEENLCIVAHIGDSRVYHIRPTEKKILYVTKDHSLINDLIACGELTPEDAKHSRQKNIITRAMQPHQTQRAKADVAILTDIREGDYFYMCSDGMLEISEDEDIVNVLSMKISDEEKLEILRGVTQDNSDNHTAHLIHITGVEKEIRQRSIDKASKKKMPWKPILVTAIVFAMAAFGYYWIKGENCCKNCISPIIEFFTNRVDSLRHDATKKDTVVIDGIISIDKTEIIENQELTDNDSQSSITYEEPEN